MAPKPKYSEGEKVLCFHGPVLYEAKILQVEIKAKEVLYLVHYQGWNKNWDEWADEDRVLKHNEEGLQKQSELKAMHSKSRKKGIKSPKGGPLPDSKSDRSSKADRDTPASRSSTPSNEKQSKHKISSVDSGAESTSTTGGETSRRRKKAKTEPLPPPDAPEEQYSKKIEVAIKIPEILKPVLVDDWDLINRQKMLVQVPCERCVDSILDDYYQHKVTTDKESRDTVLEITKGIRDYFNEMLGTQLLYKFERTQYGEILKDQESKQRTEVYGAVHLLRLFVKIGNMLSYTTMNEKSISILITHLQDFLKWMSKNRESLFKQSDYFSATADYHRKALM